MQGYNKHKIPIKTNLKKQQYRKHLRSWLGMCMITGIMNGQSIIQKLNVISNAIKSSSLSTSALINDVKELNIPRIRSKLRSDLLVYEKNVFKKHRKAASYMCQCCESTRRHKPYTLPIQCIPYSGLQDRMIGQLCDRIKEEMVKVGMIPKGKYTQIFRQSKFHQYLFLYRTCH